MTTHRDAHDAEARMLDDVHTRSPVHTLSHSRPHAGWRFSARVIGLVGLLTAAALALLYEHRVHVLGLLPWVLILLCPLLHLFGHGGHGAGPRHAAPDTDRGPQDAAEVRREPRGTP